MNQIYNQPSVGLMVLPEIVPVDVIKNSRDN